MPFPIDAVGPQATLPSDFDPTKATAGARAQEATSSMLDPQAFLQLLVAQLQYQDPSNPVDTSNFMNQTAMLSQVQSMTSMTSMLTELAAAQQTQAATSMIGKQISFLDPDGLPVSGVVSAISVRNGTSMLHVGDLAVPMSGVLEVTTPAADPVAAIGGDSATGNAATDTPPADTPTDTPDNTQPADSPATDTPASDTV